MSCAYTTYIFDTQFITICTVLYNFEMLYHSQVPNQVYLKINNVLRLIGHMHKEPTIIFLQSEYYVLFTTNGVLCSNRMISSQMHAPGASRKSRKHRCFGAASP